MTPFIIAVLSSADAPDFNVGWRMTVPVVLRSFQHRR